MDYRVCKTCAYTVPPGLDRWEVGDERLGRYVAIRRHGAAYLIAVGGAAYLVSKAAKLTSVLAFADLSMEAIHEFVVQDMPVMGAVDATGASVQQTGPSQWRRLVVRRVVAGAER